jgi:hypothetical protein
LVSLYYYGDIFPTSFYVKTPRGDIWDLILNGRYIASFLLYIGLIPVVALAIALLAPDYKKTTGVLYRHGRSIWWLYAGLFMEILYGLTMATHHMMFSFRFFVPYLPAAVILVVDLLRQASAARKVDLSAGRPAFLYAGFLVCLMLFQLYQNAYTYNRSVNGISSIGEYRELGIRDYVRFIQTLEQEAADIEQHWDVIHGDRTRPPRIITFGGGMLPYTYRESYVYEKLVSYRHCHERQDQGLYADYLHILVPRLGSLAEQLPGSRDKYSLVSSYELEFDGSNQKFLVYYNSEPRDHNLSQKIDEPCQQLEIGLQTTERIEP